MTHRFRTRVWRELPFSARRAILGTVRTVDAIELWFHNAWLSLHESPAWLFVAAAGLLGVVLTILLFLSLANELMAGTRRRSPQPIIEQTAVTPADANLIDTRLCLQPRETPQQYATEIAFADDRAWSQPSRRTTPRPTEPEWPLVQNDPPAAKPRRTVSRDDPPPELPELQPREPAGEPQLEPQVTFVRQPGLPPAGRTQLVTWRSDDVSIETVPRTQRVRRNDGWTLPQSRPLARIEQPQRYTGEADDYAGSVIGARATDEDAFGDPGAWPGRAEIALQIELHAPDHATVSQPVQSAIVVRNIGSETIRKLQVLEPLRPLDVVTGATPGGPVQQDLLQRDIQRLRAGREKTLSLAWFPIALGERQYQAQILAEAFVAASVDVSPAEPQAAPVAEPTPEPEPMPVRVRPRLPRPAPVEESPVREPEPEPRIESPPEVTPRARRKPAVECQVRGTTSVPSGNVAEWTIDVRNSGETILHNVIITAAVPQGLRHRYGDQVECAIGRLSPGESRQATLRVLGDSMGSSRTLIRVTADEPVSAQSEAPLTVTQADRKVRTGTPTRRVSEVPTRGTAFDPCCCW